MKTYTVDGAHGGAQFLLFIGEKIGSYTIRADDSLVRAKFRTRKPCYRKDDRAMRPIYGCPEKFRESLATSTATFPKIVNGLLL